VNRATGAGCERIRPSAAAKPLMISFNLSPRACLQTLERDLLGDEEDSAAQRHLGGNDESLTMIHPGYGA
jgi:hypothetical protein